MIRHDFELCPRQVPPVHEDSAVYGQGLPFHLVVVHFGLGQTPTLVVHRLPHLLAVVVVPLSQCGCNPLRPMIHVVHQYCLVGDPPLELHEAFLALLRPPEGGVLPREMP